jgi:hypothetical protein
MPEKLSIKAYQSQDRVIVLVEGSNCGSGYATTLTALEHGYGTPTLVLRNTPTCDERGYGSVGFCLNAAFCSQRALGCVQVRVAGQCVEVPVTAVTSIS